MARSRAIFFGTPAFAVPSLRALTQLAEVVTVISQPDRPSGRGMKLTAPPVKVEAEKLGIPVQQPTRIKTPEFSAALRELGADMALVVAYGRILPRAVLEAPRLGCVNVHASLLPRWRGAAPIQWSIISGDAETGVSLMQLDEGLDTGPVLAVSALPIDASETSGQLSERLALLGGALCEERLPAFLRGELVSKAQPVDGVSHAPMLSKGDGAIDWSNRSRAIHDRVRGLNPWPGAYSHLGGARIKVLRTRVVSESGAATDPGTVLRSDRHGLEVQCGGGVLALEELQLEGKRALGYVEFLSGHSVAAGARFEPAGE